MIALLIYICQNDFNLYNHIYDQNITAESLIVNLDHIFKDWFFNNGPYTNEHTFIYTIAALISSYTKNDYQIDEEKLFDESKEKPTLLYPTKNIPVDKLEEGLRYELNNPYERISIIKYLEEIELVSRML